MEFQETEISALDLRKSPEIISRLIIRDFCGENYDLKLTVEDKNLLKKLLINAENRGMNYRQFNELLLLLNQNKVGKDFFDFFFQKEKITLDELKKGIIKFRGFAMLCFGNFRFAYKQLINRSWDDLNYKLLPYCKQYCELMKEFKERPPKMLEINKIPREKTWFLGYISGTKVDKEADELNNEIEKAKKRKSKFSIEELNKFKNRLIQISIEIEGIQEQALINTDIYLTWDYMDIYIATSMRNKWEFEDTFNFIQIIEKGLNEFKIRYFDPTQSICSNPRDKGLIEGMMLKRALCTIYLAQESDTMGKDSELAATLAQSKPVIAYVPKYDPKEYSKKISSYPLDFFKKRLLILRAEGIFSDSDCIGKIEEIDPNFKKTINIFIDEIANYRINQPFSLWTEKENKFKRTSKNFSKICKILAVGECCNFDKRIRLLKGRHPLSMQVDLQFGVANGVLVVRTPQKCIELLKRILTNQMKFIIRREEGYIALEEEVSGSHFRVVTKNERLTNSFWNFFT